MANWANAVTGGMSGAAVGSTFGPWGTAVGGAVGAATGMFSSKKKKQKRKKPEKLSTLDPQQQQLYGDYQQSIYGNGPLAGMYNWDAEGANNVFDQNVSRPAYRNFQENVIPGITGQFRGGNIQNSSYTGEALSRAGRNVQENLDAQRANMQFQGQQQANQNKMNAIPNILNTQTFAYQQPQAQEQKKSGIDQILDSVGPAAGKWFADYITSKMPKG